VSTISELPLIPRTQTLRTDMAGTTYTLHFRYNRACGSWVMNVGDADDVLILGGIPLVTGTDLFGQFRYMGIGGGIPMIVMTIGPGVSPDTVPTYENLGIDGRVFFKTP
jgi:hypothetical protein